MQAHAAVSPCGEYVVWATDSKICRQNMRRRGVSSYAIAAHFKKVAIHKFSADGTRILQIHETGADIFTDALERLAKLSNGSGGLGRIASADFIDNHHILVTWEFGRTRLWHVNSIRALDLPDIKTTCDGRPWQKRPGTNSPSLFAMLTRTAAEDQLVLQFTSVQHSPTMHRLPTTDVQSLEWSPDGRWLALLDVPTRPKNLHIYTPDGHLFRSHPAKESEDAVGIKGLVWSMDSRILALAQDDGRVELLNARTFFPLAAIEHNTTIDQSTLPVSEQASLWQESVSATNDRSYAFVTQPFSPPLSHTKASPDLSEQGVAEICFSCDGCYLATRDSRMLNTVWIWNLSKLSPHAVILQHNNVRKMSWHPTRAELLLIDCADAIATIYNTTSAEPPTAHQTGSTPVARLSWIHTTADEKAMIAVIQKTKFDILCPEGWDEAQATPRQPQLSVDAPFEEGVSEDSLFDVLSGRKPLPPKTTPSYTEMVDINVETENTEAQGSLEDTFREKRKPLAAELDPLDDSEIF